MIRGKVIKSKFGLSPNGWDTKEALRVTFRSPWKFISSCLEEFHKHFSFKVGDGLRMVLSSSISIVV